jgi:hypothetical protein
MINKVWIGPTESLTSRLGLAPAVLDHLLDAVRPLPPKAEQTHRSTRAGGRDHMAIETDAAHP